MKALTIGGALIDTIAVIADDRIERLTRQNDSASYLLLEEGRKIDAHDVSAHCGGGAVNAAVALARLGHNVSALIKLGQDSRAETILARLAQEGVSTRFAIRDARLPTGASVFVSSHDRNAAIFTFRGANTLLEPADLKMDAFAVDLVYVSGLSNGSATCFQQIIAMAKASGALVATNPGIRQLTGRREQFCEMIGRIDLVMINRHEAGALVPWLSSHKTRGDTPLRLYGDGALPELMRNGFTIGGSQLSLSEFLTGMRRVGPRWVVVTDGGDGAYVGDPSGIVHCPAIPTNVAGTAGAGDAFASTFAAYIAQNASTDEALQAATVNAASVIGYLDTQTGLLRRKDLEARRSDLRGAMKLQRWNV